MDFFEFSKENFVVNIICVIRLFNYLALFVNGICL